MRNNRVKTSTKLFGVSPELLITISVLTLAMVGIVVFWGTQNLRKDLSSINKANEFIIEIAEKYDNSYENLSRYINCLRFNNKNCDQLKLKAENSLEILTSNNITVILKAHIYFRNSVFFSDKFGKINSQLYDIYYKINKLEKAGGSADTYEEQLDILKGLYRITLNNLLEHIQR